MEIKATNGMSYNVLKEAAETLNINYVGIKKEALVDTINEQIEKRPNSLEVTMVQALFAQAANAPAESEVDNEQADQTDDGIPQAEVTHPEPTSVSTPVPAAPTATKPRTVSTGQKWYEKEDCLYNEGDRIEIIDGVLKGRFAIVNKPSSKEHAVKAFLIKKGTVDELQNTNVTLDYINIKLAQPATTETGSGEEENGQQVG